MRYLGGVASARLRGGVVVAVAVAGLGALSFSGMEESLVYYVTPTEVAAAPPSTAERVRLGGLVVPGSVQRSGETVRLVLTDGVNDVHVLHRGAIPEIFEEGQGAIVEGRFDDRAWLVSDRLMVKHSNEYKSPEEATAAGEDW